MKQLLIRADDLGYSEGINYGIAKSVREGLVRSVGVMTNMPTVAQGLRLLEGHKVCYGQHTNICLGRPLTDPALIPSLCQENGEFKTSKTYRSAAKSGGDFVVLDEAILEAEAQYRRFRELTGTEPGYFECHAVASDNFFKALEIVAERHDLPYLPFPVKPGPVLFRHTQIYSHMPPPGEDPFNTVKDVVENAHEGACDMIVFHPGYIDAYLMATSSMTAPRAIELEMLCRPEVRQWLEQQDIELVTYDDLM